MRIPFRSFFISSPFTALKEHAEKVKECTWAFQQTMECYLLKQCLSFEEQKQYVINIEYEADTIKRRIRSYTNKKTFMSLDKFQLFLYLKEQDYILDGVNNAISWIAYRDKTKFPEEFQKEFLLLFDAVIEPIEELNKMVMEAEKYFKKVSEKQRNKVKDIIRNIRKMEYSSNRIEQGLKRNLFASGIDAITLFHLVRLVEIIGSIADHAENAADIMRAMIIK